MMHHFRPRSHVTAAGPTKPGSVTLSFENAPAFISKLATTPFGETIKQTLSKHPPTKDCAAAAEGKNMIAAAASANGINLFISIS
jgi:hypothetical protein